MILAQFLAKHEARDPAKAADNPDQLRRLEAEDGVVALGTDGAGTVLVQPGSRPGTPAGRCLWVIEPSEVPAILESAPDVRAPLQSGIAKHTNLTGGGPASCGGECWGDGVVEKRLWVTGGSGRYPPRSSGHLDDAVALLRGLGYDVRCAGWSLENDCAERVFRDT